MKKYMKNKGFSLVELIVVIAILGVMTAVGGYALTAISSANAKECAREIEAGLISTRTESYSRDTATDVITVSFYKNADGVYMEKKFKTETETKKIGGSKVSVSYKYKTNTNPATETENVLGNDAIVFSFNRSSGAFREMKVGANTVGMCKTITITSGSKTYTITCYEHTGKTMLE